MKKLLPAFLISAILFSSCTNDTSKGKFFVEGELSAVPDQQIYLEELYFSEKNAEVLDTGTVTNGKFSLSAMAAQQGIYRLRTQSGKNTYLFINDGDKKINVQPG